MTTIKGFKVKALPEEATLLAPHGMSVREIFLQTKLLWINEKALFMIPFPFDYGHVQGEYHETDSETFVAFEKEFIERVKLDRKWKIRRVR